MNTGLGRTAHLLSDVKLRAISVTQSKLLRAGQRPAEDREKSNSLVQVLKKQWDKLF